MISFWEIILVTIIVLLSFFLGSLVFLKNRLKKINLFFLLFAISTGGYIATAFSSEFFPLTNPFLAILLTKFTYVIVLWWIVFLFFFSFFFPLELTLEMEKKNINLISRIVYPTASFLSLAILFTNLFIKNIKIKPWGFDVVYGELYIIFLVFVFLLFIFAAINFIKNYKKSDKLSKTQVKYFLLGLGLYFIISIIFNVVLPVFWGIEQYYRFGNYSAIFFLGFTAYAIVAKHLFDIKVLLTELFVGIISLLLVVQTFLASNLSWKIIDGFIFLLFLFFGYFLIKATLKEVQLREETEKLSQAKSEFISMASHQLRTPLTAIKGYLSMMIDGSWGNIPQAAKEKMENIFQSTERLIRIVADLLDVSKIELGKMELEKEETDIKELVKSCYEELKITADKKGLNYTLDITPEPLPNLNIDSLKVRQVIMNLIDNSLKYTLKGEVKVKLEKKGNNILISIKDTGDGLAEKEKKDIFEGFVRGSAGIDYFIEGAGLGLYVAKKFLDIQKGKIWAESEGKGKGSTFFVQLPIE